MSRLVHFLFAVLAVPTAMAQAAPVETASFCQSLAGDLRMKPVATTPDGPAGWKVNLMGGLGPALFGGSAIASFSVSPIDKESLAEFRRASGACEQTAKGATCRIEGPALFTVGTKAGKVERQIGAGRRATVEMKGISIFCHEGPWPAPTPPPPG